MFKNCPDDPSADHVILKNTALGKPPLVPEIRIHLLRDVSPLWQSFEDTAKTPAAPRPYWAFAWSGGQALARYVLDHPKTVARKRVLDFGAGCGIAAIAAAKAHAAKVTASEIDPVAIRAIALNGQANHVQIQTLHTDLIYSERQDWDVVLAGDIWYDTRLARHGQRWLRGLAAIGVTVLIGDPGRTYSPSEDLRRLADYTCRSVPDLEHPNLRQVFVYRLLP